MIIEEEILVLQWHIVVIFRGKEAHVCDLQMVQQTIMTTIIVITYIYEREQVKQC